MYPLGDYRLIRLLHRSEAEAIRKQTGLEIPFRSGESIINHHELEHGVGKSPAIRTTRKTRAKILED